MANTIEQKTPGQLAKSSATEEPRIKVELSEPDERGQRTAQVELLIAAAELAQFNASVGSEGDAFTNGIISNLCHAAQGGTTIDEGQRTSPSRLFVGCTRGTRWRRCSAHKWQRSILPPLRAAANLGSAKNPQLVDQHERAMNRLARTFAAQVEALKRYRSKGEQRVYVERVTVNEGGQAIVGSVAHTGRGGGSSENDG